MGIYRLVLKYVFVMLFLGSFLLESSAVANSKLYCEEEFVKIIEGEDFEDLENKIKRLESPSSPAYRLLAIAYYKVDRPRDSAIAMQKALKINMDALEDTQAVCAVAYSLVAIGELAAADDDLLVKHLKVRPGASEVPAYQKASAFVAKEIQKSGEGDGPSH